MAKDADGNYYYDEGTLAEQLDEWEVYEDSDGNVGFYKASADAELRLHEAGHVFGDARPAPEEQELADGEIMLFVNESDGELTAAVGSATDDETAAATEVLTALVA